MDATDQDASDGAKSGGAEPAIDPAASGLGRRVFVGVAAVGGVLAMVFSLGEYSRHRANGQLQAAAVAAAAEMPAVDVVAVTRAAPTRILALPAEARAFYETTVFARTSGYLKKWCADIGDRVDEGQLLATIETPELDDQLAEAQAKVDSLLAESKLARAAADFAKISFDRFDTADGVVSQQERDEKRSNLETSLAHVEVADANIALGKAEVARLQTLEGFKRVTAPFAGIVTERRVDRVDLVTAGSSTSTTLLFRLSQYETMRVFVDVPQEDSAAIRVGMHVKAFAPERRDKIYAGTVDRTAGAIDPAGRTLKVEVLVANPDLSLLPGTYLQVEFEATREHAPLRIPSAALLMKPSGPEVAVVGSDGTVSFRPIRIEQDLGEVIEVDHGLEEGDMVALNISRDVRDGGRVIARTN